MTKIGQCCLVGMLILGMATSAASHEVGWILMLPPVVFEGERPVVVIDAPLSKWEIDHSFDTARECQDYKGRSFLDLNKLVEAAGGRSSPSFGAGFLNTGMPDASRHQ